MFKYLVLIICIIFCISFLLNCSKSDSKRVELLGAGATFPLPLYQRMFDEYNRQTGTRVNYQGIGSGGGIRQITAKTVDFGGTDAFLSEERLAEIDGELLHIPICLGSVVVTYNIPGNPDLRFDGNILSKIFLGKITNWNDKRIAALNPGVSLPNLDITVTTRADGSGTTFVFTDYLSKVNEEFKNSIGMGSTVNWTIGVSGRGNPGVAGLVSQVSGSIGYVELIYALQNNLSFGKIKNSSGNFIIPSLETTSMSAQIDIPDHTRISITNTDAPNGYPISSFTWILIYKEQSYNNRSENTARELLNLLWWMTHEGQYLCETVDYAPLPDKAVEKVELLLKSVTFNGRNILEK